jgi:hypothetical protein
MCFFDGLGQACRVASLYTQMVCNVLSRHNGIVALEQLEHHRESGEQWSIRVFWRQLLVHFGSWGGEGFAQLHVNY